MMGDVEITFEDYKEISGDSSNAKKQEVLRN